MADILSDAIYGISRLPSEVLVEILERVDLVHSLLQARLVSKSWLSATSVRVTIVKLYYLSRLTPAYWYHTSESP
jgi:hypothetical protein